MVAASAFLPRYVNLVAIRERYTRSSEGIRREANRRRTHGRLVSLAATTGAITTGQRRALPPLARSFPFAAESPAGV